MSIRFVGQRLHVGYHAKDWAEVWAEPKKLEDGEVDKDDEGEAEIFLFSHPTKKAGYREPMFGEVKWLPHLDIANCESPSKPERARLQKRFLTDACSYLTETDQSCLRKLERKLNQLKSAKWQTWFAEAKKFKRSQMNGGGTGIDSPTERGDDGSQRAKRKSPSGTDSAIGSDREDDPDTISESNTEDFDSRYASEMPPPARPRKRGANGLGINSSNKKRRLDSYRQQTSPLFMSGAAGSSMPSVGRSSATTTRSNSPRTDWSMDDDSYDATVWDETMDTRDPNAAETGSNPRGSVTGWNFDALTSGQDGQRTSGQRPRGSDTHNDHAGVIELDSDGDEEVKFKQKERAARHAREQSNLYTDDDAALREGMRQSMEPQVKPSGRENHLKEEDEDSHETIGRDEQDEDIVESIEKDADDD